MSAAVAVTAIAVPFVAASNGMNLMAGEVACDETDLTLSSVGLNGGLGIGMEGGPAVDRCESDCAPGLASGLLTQCLRRISVSVVRPYLIKALRLWLGLISLMIMAMRR